MLLIADSGSTKCDWIGSSERGTLRFSTMGFNPFFHSTELIISEINKNAELINYAERVKNLFFYGSGASSPERVAIIFNALKFVFPNAEIIVNHDMVGSVYATCGSDPGIACIIGTGSNSCYYDGKNISEKVPALGYILGDEGSGTWLGKILLRDYLYHDLPEKLETAFKETFGLSKEDIFDSIYKKAHVNVYLASFAKFLGQFKDDEYVRSIVKNGFDAFIKVHVCKFEEHKTVPVHFVGSVANGFSEILRTCGDSFGITIGKITNEPALGLLEYHTGVSNQF